MNIDPDKCISCGECMRYCPMNCMSQGESSVSIDKDECVECGVCLHVGVCPVDAIYMPPESLEYPRAIRMQFSDPGAEHPNLKAWGRGTEEAKTNDVTGKFAKGEYGMLFEFGRPVTGTRFTEVQKITMAVCKMGLEILEDNPIYGLLDDATTGTIKKEFLNEKILSAILEIKFEAKRLDEIVTTIFPLFDELDTVISVGLVSRFSDEGTLPVIGHLENLGIAVRPNAKINVGLGRPIVN